MLCLLSCGGKSGEQAAVTTRALDASALHAALTTYADIALASYEESARLAEQLARTSQELAKDPSDARLEQARAAWRAARVPYAQSEVFRFYDGPIDRLELAINTWPIDESYVESLPDEASLGIVQDSAQYPALSAELLARLNGQAGETAISTGYHVIEFLLWGRDESESGPGQRSWLAFVVAKPTKGEPSLAARRSAYLTLACQLLLEQLGEVRDAWKKDVPNNYRATFLALPPEQALYLALKGMAKLSGPELSGERLTVAYETKNQENEHSCFSDNTQSDLANNALGIENVCLGRYASAGSTRVQGRGLCGVIAHSAAQLGKRLISEVSASARACAQIPTPFDHAILGDDAAPGRVAIARAIAALRAQANTLDQVQAALKLPEPSVQSASPSVRQ